MSGWRQHARQVIAKVIEEAEGLDIDTVVIPRIDAAYPFGSRAHWPYKVWLSERRHAIALLRGQPMTRGDAEHPLTPPYVPDPAMDAWLRRAAGRAS